jgi:hypothetical protein
MSHETLANSTDLDLWAERITCRSEMPRLLRRLIQVTCPDVQRVGFPADEGIQLGGFDGTVFTAAGNAYVPQGGSVWEIGATKDIKGKANDDYNKRSQNPLDITPDETTFVFVTPRRWGGKDDWVKERNGDGIWHEVRAYDAEDLAQWLEMAGGVHLWLSELLCKRPQGVQTLEDFWTSWSRETHPPIESALVIGGRNQKRDELLEWLRGEPSAMVLAADSQEEAIVFVAAVVKSLETEERVSLLSRTVIVEDMQAWRSLFISSSPLILIPRFDNPEGIGQHLHQGHRSLVPMGRIGSQLSDFLPRISRDVAEAILVKMGVEEERARRLASLARRSLSALRRKLALAPGIQVPDWAQPTEATSLLGMLLAGSWNDAVAGDREILSQLTHRPYEQVQQTAIRWMNAPDPPLRRVGDLWMLASREDAWRLIARFLTSDDLKQFEVAALQVLAERDPALDLPNDKRFAASIYGKIMKHSGQLRSGLTETLALMATLSSEITFAASLTGSEIARRVLWTLMQKAEGDDLLWASLSALLPLLAEAAPGVLLDAVDTGLAEEDPILIRLFQDNSNAIFGSSPHVGLLWALEVLAWCSEYFGRSVFLIARMARLEPGGKRGNRPLNSLRAIFLAWSPCTSANQQSRLTVLKALCRREPKVAWPLLVALLPRNHATAFPTHKPSWHTWADTPNRKPSVNEYIEETTEVLHIALSEAGADAARWCDLIDSGDQLIGTQRETYLTHLENLAPSFFSSEEKVQIQSHLRNQIGHHREFPEADWVMPPEHLDRLEQSHDRFEPEDHIARSRWLFRSYVEIPGLRRVEREERDNELSRLRALALHNILQLEGWGGIYKLAAEVEAAGYIGITLAKSGLLAEGTDNFLRESLASLVSGSAMMARGFVATSAGLHGEEWLQERLTAASTWQPKQLGEFLAAVALTPAILDILDNSIDEVQQHFWNECRYIALADHPEETDRLITAMLKFHRADLACEAIEFALTKPAILLIPDRIADVLEAALEELGESRTNISSFAYITSQLLDHLEQTELPRERLALLEWRYFGLHTHSRPPKILHEALANEPEFFIEMLKHVYHAKDDIAEKEITDQQKLVATQAWNLLYSWKLLPGRNDKDIDALVLHTWIVRVRELAVDCDRKEIADIHIGHILSFAPVDPDGAWPHQVVREIIEELASPDIENGWQTQIANNRGVTSRRPTDGGGQENALAAQYDDYANQIGDVWPRTANVLRTIAENYRGEAKREDLQAELTQDLW